MQRKRSPYAIPVMLAVAALLALLVYGVVQTKGGDKIDRALAAGRHESAAVRRVRRIGTPGTTSIADHRGKVVLLNFWASWCDACKAESPAIERAYLKYRDRGFTVIGADVDDLTEKAQAFARRYKLTYPMVKYGSDNAAKDFGTRALPESFLIDPKGRIVAMQRYEIDDKWLESHVPKALEEAGL
ncbi:MAG: TlpA family protein disulfide reductase [Actinobacteria bacterium]|nr:TlpA family protein disulfide reductase [Actinomycetota bacterium]